MKKIICAFLCGFMIILLFGCTRKIVAEETTEQTSESEVTETDTETSVPETTAPVTAAEIEPETEPETTAAPETETSSPIASPPKNPVTSGGGDGIHSSVYSDQTPHSPSVLMYHLILDEPFTDLTGLFVRPSEFEDQLNAMNKAGYEYLFADEYAYSSNKCVMLTFDDGYVDNYTEMFPILKKYNARATIFMIGYKIDTEGYLSSDMIREMAASGLVHFGSHTLSHYDLRGQSDDTVRSEFNGSKWIISQLTGQKVDAVCYPAGGFDSRISTIASEYFSFGYTTKSAAHTDGAAPLEIPRLRVSRGTAGASLVGQLGG